jgi:Cu(I)/Ag(I) efflux system membrane protein CusA/SilA
MHGCWPSSGRWQSSLWPPAGYWISGAGTGGRFLLLILLGAAAFPLMLLGCRWLGRWRLLGRSSLLAGLLLTALAAGRWMSPLGHEFVPPLDEGSILDMPVTVPRASMTEAADDLIARDRLLRTYPEVELVVGKAGRAETPTDPSPPDMIETVINLRPRELWPKRKLEFSDAFNQVQKALEKMVNAGWIKPRAAADRSDLLNAAAMEVLARFDRAMATFALQQYAEAGNQLPGKIKEINWRLFDYGAGFFCREAVDAILKGARRDGSLIRQPSEEEIRKFAVSLEDGFARSILLWRKSKADLLKQMDTEIQVPGWANIWTQPIINRVDMLATGVRTMIGVKVFGSDLKAIQKVAGQVADVLRRIPGAVDVFPDQIIGEGYLEIDIDRGRAARYGIGVGDIQDVVETALGGKVITLTVEGRERFPIRIRYARAFREDEERVRNLLVSAGKGMEAKTPGGSTMGMGGSEMNQGTGGPPALLPAASPPHPPMQVPLAMVADVKLVEGPSVIKSENGLLRAYVQLNVRDRDIVGFVDEARQAVAAKVKLPPGMYLEWSGQFEHQVRARKTLQVIFPLVVLVIFVILYVTYNDLSDALLMMFAVPGAVAGGVFFQWLFGFNFSVAVWVGFIACFGLATETGIVMLVYLREAVENAGGLARLDLPRLRQAVIEGAVHRLRPKLLTEGTTIIGLAPMLWATGTGAEIMRPMAAPVLGGILVADEIIDLLLPVLFYVVRRRRWKKIHPRESENSE